ncbi:hypothetical protein JW707_03895 [Candidatus Woesearchaeota archaeon]|nr:hypothetical protein [Candidatus Woesearchaeota archaeon]
MMSNPEFVNVLTRVLVDTKAGAISKKSYDAEIKEVRVKIHGVKSNMDMDLFISPADIRLNTRKGVCEMIISNKRGINNLRIEIDPQMAKKLANTSFFVVTAATDEITLTF